MTAVIGTLYEKASKEMYNKLQDIKGLQKGEVLDLSASVNEMLGGMLNVVGRTVILSRTSKLQYPDFQIPVSEYGNLIEYIGTKLLRPQDVNPHNTGDAFHTSAINNPKFITRYISDIVRGKYNVTTGDQRWLDAINKKDEKRIANLTGQAVQSLYDSLIELQNDLVPALFASLYEKVKTEKSNAIWKIPSIADSTDIKEYSIVLNAQIKKAVRLLSYTSSDYNLLGADVNSKKDDLILVAFHGDDVSAYGVDTTLLDVITSQGNLGTLSRATFEESLGLNKIVEMKAMGIGQSTIPRDFDLPALIGMQTEDIDQSTVTTPYGKVRFALVSKGMLNVGLKYFKAKTEYSASEDINNIYVHFQMALEYGAGQVIFFEDNEVESEVPPEG